MKEKLFMLIKTGKDGDLISEIIGLPDCRAQAQTLAELVTKTKEAAYIYLKEKPERSTKFVGLYQVEV